MNGFLNALQKGFVAPTRKLVHPLFFVFLITAICAFAPSNCVAQDALDLNEAERMMSIEVVELRDQLVFGLRTSIPAQQEFIDLVIARVDSGELPRAMINVVFVWARKRNPRMPYPYFEVALRLLADRRGVDIPYTESIVVAQ